MNLKLKIIFLFICIVIISCLCLAPVYGVTTNNTFTVTTITEFQNPTSFYITVNPIADHTIGDILNVTGTTNLPGNTTLEILGQPHTFTMYEPAFPVEYANVIPGNGTNTWSVTMNTSSFTIDQYGLIAVPATNDFPNTSSYGVRFNMTPRNTSSPRLTEIPTDTTTPSISTNTTIANTPIPSRATPTSLSRTPTPSSVPTAVPVIVIGMALLWKVNKVRK